MNTEEAKNYIKNRPKAYLERKHGIAIRGNNNSKCPICGGNNKSSKFSIRHDNFMKCFSCGFSGDILDLIASDNGLDIKRDFYEILKVACEEFNISLNEEQPYKIKPKQQGGKPVTETYQATQAYDFTSIILHAHNKVSETEYFKNRGFSKKLIEKYKLGFSPKGYNILLQNYPDLQVKTNQQHCYQYVIPILNADDTCNYFLVRANNSLKPDKYNNKVLNMKNFEQKNPARLFNDRYIISHLDYDIKTLFIVEGWADALSIEAVGYHALALNSTSNARKFINLCLTYKPKMRFIICLDSDEAGEKTKKFLLNELTKHGFPATEGGINGSHKDINEFFLQDEKLFSSEIKKAWQETNITPVTRESFDLYTPVREIGNAYYITQSKNEKCVSNFVMKPISLIIGVDGGIYTVQFHCCNGKVLEKQFKSSALSSARTFKQMINKDDAELSFMGTDSDLENIKIYIFQTYPDYEKKTGTDHVGIFKHNEQWMFIDTDKAINAQGKIDTSVAAFISVGHIFENNLISAKPIKKEDFTELSKRLFHFNKLTRAVTIIAWCSACFLKERLSQRKIKMSNLFLHGLAGSGKSDTSSNMIMPIFGIDREPLSCSNIKEFALLMVCSTNNVFPVVLDEYKPAKLGSFRVDLISRTLRSAYDGHRTDRGHQDQSVTSYQYRSPIVLIGESSIEEKAVKERMIEVLFGKLDRTKEHTENYFFFKKNSKLLNSFGQGLLFQALKLSDAELDSWINEAECFQNLDFETRNINGLSILFIGMKLIQKLFQEHGLNFEKEIKYSSDDIADIFITNLKESLDINGCSKSAVEQIIETFDIMAGKKLILDNVHYVVNKASNELQLYVPKLYPEFTKYFKDYNLSNDIEYLNKGDFIKQLKGTEYYLKHDGRVFKNDSTFKKYKCFILDLKLISHKLETDIFYCEANQDGFIDDVQEGIPFKA